MAKTNKPKGSLKDTVKEAMEDYQKELDHWFGIDTDKDAAKIQLEKLAKKAYNGPMDEHIKIIRDNFYFKGQYPELVEIHRLLDYVRKLQNESIAPVQKPQSPV